jgi:hypothetical protein
MEDSDRSGEGRQEKNDDIIDRQVTRGDRHEVGRSLAGGREVERDDPRAALARSNDAVACVRGSDRDRNGDLREIWLKPGD